MNKKADRPELPPQRAPEKINWINQPERICGNCHHRDAAKGACHNLISGRWKVGAKDSACARGWYPDVERFPLEKRFHA